MLERDVRFMNFNFCAHAKYSLASRRGQRRGSHLYFIYIAIWTASPRSAFVFF